MRSLILPRRRLLKVTALIVGTIAAPAIVRAQIFNPPMFMPQPASGAVVTWSAGNSDVNYVLSGGNLVATVAATATLNYVARGNTTFNAKAYFEVVQTAGGAPGANILGVGITGAGFVLDESSFLGQTAAAICCYNQGGAVFTGGAQTGTDGGWNANADNMGVAVDNGNQKIWFRLNGGNWNNSGTANPATNTLGISISGLSAPYLPAVIARTANLTAAFTANFTSASWAFSAPAGFSHI
jgi:hypothetical protein